MPTFSKLVPTFLWHLSKRWDDFCANIIEVETRCKQMQKKNCRRRAKRAASAGWPADKEAKRAGPPQAKRRRAGPQADQERSGPARWKRSGGGRARKPTRQSVSSVTQAERRLRAWRRSSRGGGGRRGGTRKPPRDGRGRREAPSSGLCPGFGVANFTPYYLTG